MSESPGHASLCPSHPRGFPPKTPPRLQFEALSVLITFDGDHRAILFHLVGWDGRLNRSDYYLVETLLAVPTPVLGTFVYCLLRPGAWGKAGDSVTTMT